MRERSLATRISLKDTVEQLDVNEIVKIPVGTYPELSIRWRACQSGRALEREFAVTSKKEEGYYIITRVK